MYAVVGLGNPGDEYRETRHNVGFNVVEEIARRWGVEFSRPRRGSRVARAQLGGRPVILVEPLTFMNLSGDALARLDADIRPHTSELVVVHDELDLPCGRVMIKKGGGAGGHHGLTSVIACMGSDFIRTRIGIGRPPAGDASSYVLRRFRNDERALVDEAVRRAADAVESILNDGTARAMSIFNAKSAPGPDTEPTF